MKNILLAIYSIVISSIILALLYLASPYVVDSPKIALVIFALAMLTSLGAGIRSMLEMGILWPMVKIANGTTKSFFSCPFIFLIAMLVAVALPWLNGASNFNAWCWASSIAFTMFNFETFYAFVCAALRIYNCDNKTEYERR